MWRNWLVGLNRLRKAGNICILEWMALQVICCRQIAMFLIRITVKFAKIWRNLLRTTSSRLLTTRTSFSFSSLFICKPFHQYSISKSKCYFFEINTFTATFWFPKNKTLSSLKSKQQKLFLDYMNSFKIHRIL